MKDFRNPFRHIQIRSSGSVFPTADGLPGTYSCSAICCWVIPFSSRSFLILSLKAFVYTLLFAALSSPLVPYGIFSASCILITSYTPGNSRGRKMYHPGCFHFGNNRISLILQQPGLQTPLQFPAPHSARHTPSPHQNFRSSSGQQSPVRKRKML